VFAGLDQKTIKKAVAKRPHQSHSKQLSCQSKKGEHTPSLSAL
jgi:hypothetical protein